METIAGKLVLCHNVVMKKPRKIIWKIYAFIFSLMMLANLTWLVYPESEPFVFYHVLIAWTKFYYVHYYLAIFKSSVAILCLIPLFAFAFNQETKAAQFWQWMFLIRFASDLVGNFYEFIFIKSAYHMILGYGLSITGAFLLPLLPSYIAHYLYAFKKQ